MDRVPSMLVVTPVLRLHQAIYRGTFARLPVGLFGEVVGAAGCVVADLVERGDVDRVVELSVPVRVQPVPYAWSR